MSDNIGNIYEIQKLISVVLSMVTIIVLLNRIFIIISKVIYGETPTNPKLAVLDLAELVQVTKDAPSGALSIVDSTFGTPYLQQPVKFGIDIVFHSW